MQTDSNFLGFRRWDILFFCAAFVFLYSHLFLFPATPFFYEGDHVALLNDAKRMFEGEVLYRDIFEFTFPGGPALYYLLMCIFGPKYWIVNAAILFHGIAAAILALYIGRKVVGDSLYAYLPPAIFLFFGFRWYGIDGEHRLFSPVFVALAIALILPRRSMTRLALAGGACALASYFTQQRGLVTVAAIGLFLLIDLGFRERNWVLFLKSGFVLSLSFAAALLLLVLPNLLSAGSDTFFSSTIVFLASYIEDPSTNSLQTYWGTLKKISEYGVTMTIVAAFYYLLVPLIYLAGLVFVWIKRKAVSFSEVSGLVLVCIAGIFLAAGTPGPNAGRLFQISLPAIVAFVFLISRIRPENKVVPGVVVLLLVAFGLIGGTRLQTAWKPDVVETPSGRLAFLSPVIEERYVWMLEHTKPGDIVYETYNAHVNFPLHLKNPSKVSILLNSGYSPPEHVAQAIADLKRIDTKYIIWDGTWTAEMDRMRPDERLKPFYSYLIENYRLVHSFTPYDGRIREVWEKIRSTPN